MKQTTESAFESCIEHALLTRPGWQKGAVQGRDKDRALFPAEALAFIRETHPALWEGMANLHGAEFAPNLTAAL